MGSGQGFLNSVWIYVSRLLTHPVVRRKSAVFTRGPMLLEQSCTDECSNEWTLTVITSMVDGGGGGVCVWGWALFPLNTPPDTNVSH